MEKVLLDVVVLHKSGPSDDWVVEILCNDGSEPQFLVICSQLGRISKPTKSFDCLPLHRELLNDGDDSGNL